MYSPYPIKDGSPKIKLAVLANFSFDFELVLGILFKFCIVFGPFTTATKCRDADFFPVMYIILFIYLYVY